MNNDLKTTHRAPIVLLDESAMIYDPTYSLAVGNVRKGKSAFFEEEALRRGITCEELIEQLKPTPEQREQYQLAQQEKNLLERQRLMAVREAFWQNTPTMHEDLTHLHDVLVETNIVEDPTVVSNN